MLEKSISKYTFSNSELQYKNSTSKLAQERWLKIEGNILDIFKDIRQMATIYTRQLKEKFL